jgi:hypothetical protein
MDPKSSPPTRGCSVGRGDVQVNVSVLPADRAAADSAAAIVAELAPGTPEGEDAEIDVTWHDTLTVIDSGENLEKIVCPLCGATIGTEWWADLLEAHCDDGFATLAGEAPCCGGETSPDALGYDWPSGFARFEIAIWNPERDWFSDGELTALADALGHAVRQVRAYI